MSGTYRRDLPAQTTIRGLAACLVFLAHTQFELLFPGSTVANILHRPFQWNDEAVDMFFLLSGFILCYVYGSRPSDWRRYAWARFSRIYPLYIASVAFFLALAIVQYVTTRTVSDKLGTGNVLSNILLLQCWPWPWPALSLNYPTWSISVEAFLYLFVFPTLFYLLRPETAASTKRKQTVLFVAIYLLIAILWGLHGELDAARAAGIEGLGYWNPFLRGICGFIAGYLLSLLAQEWKYRPIISRPLEGAMLAIFAFSLLVAPMGSRAVLLVLTPLLIYSAAAQASLTTTLLSPRPLTYLGDLSYSIYVWHAPVLAVVSRLFGVRDSVSGDLIAPGGSGLALGYLLAAIGGVMVVAHVSYFHFELPVKALLRRWSRS